MHNSHNLEIVYSPINQKPQGLYFQYGQIAKQLTAEAAAAMSYSTYKTALRWLNCVQQPSNATLELLFLKATGRIMPYTKSWEGCYFSDGKLYSDSCRAFTPSELAMIEMTYNQNNRLTLENKQLHAENTRIAQMQVTHSLPLNF